MKNSTTNATAATTSDHQIDHFAPVYSDFRSQLVFGVLAFLTLTVGNYLLALFACYVGRNQYVVLTDRMLDRILRRVG